jgi:hypothetical protein
MAVKQLSDGRPDGVMLGQSASDKLGHYGVTAVVQATIAAAGTDAATTQTLANDLRTKLIALGLVAA